MEIIKSSLPIKNNEKLTTKKIIKVCHIHFDTKKNKGDEAIVLAIKQELERVFNTSNKTMEYFEVDIYYLKLVKYPKIADNKLLKHIFNNFDPDKFWSRFGLSNFWQKIQTKKKQKILANINQADLVVIGGGGVFYGGLLPFDDSFINQIKPNLVIFGAGYNQLLGIEFLGDDEIKSLQNLIQKASLVGVRDNYSLDLLQNIEHKSPIPVSNKNQREIKKNLKLANQLKSKIVLCPDPAILLNNITPQNLDFNPSQFHLGLNIALHSPLLKSKLEQTPNVYLNFINTLLLSANCPLNQKYINNLDTNYINSLSQKLPIEIKTKIQKGLILHLFVHTQNELDFGIFLLKKLSNTDYQNAGLRLQIHTNQPAELKWIYTHTDFNLTMMLHSAIFAFCANQDSQNVNNPPFINLGYDVKNLAFMDLIEQTKNYFDIVSTNKNSLELSNQLYQKFIDLIAHNQNELKLKNNKNNKNKPIKGQLKDKKTHSKLIQLQSLTQKFTDKIATLIK